MSEHGKNPIARITDAVCDVLADQGVSALSMRNVAAKAEATIGLITHHFPNRAAMVEAAVKATWLREQAVVAWPETPDRAAILRAVEVFLPLDEERRRQLSVWVAYWALAQHDAALQQIHVDVHATIRENHMRWILALGFAPDEARRLADRLCVSFDGVLLYALLDPTYWTPERQLDTARGIIDEVFAAHARRQDGAPGR